MGLGIASAEECQDLAFLAQVNNSNSTDYLELHALRKGGSVNRQQGSWQCPNEQLQLRHVRVEQGQTFLLIVFSTLICLPSLHASCKGDIVNRQQGSWDRLKGHGQSAANVPARAFSLNLPQVFLQLQLHSQH